MAKLNVQNTEIIVISHNEDDYISLTDMLKAKDGDFFFSNWLRNRNTIEFLGIWERLMNPNFNCAEFDIIKSQAVISKAGRYGGTYAHKDIAFEFAMWISPEFKVYLIREFQRLKDDMLPSTNLYVLPIWRTSMQFSLMKEYRRAIVSCALIR